MLADSPHAVYVAGGRVRGKELSVYGPVAAEQVQSYWSDLELPAAPLASALTVAGVALLQRS